MGNLLVLELVLVLVLVLLLVILVLVLPSLLPVLLLVLILVLLLRWRHMIRNCIFRCEGLGISYFWIKIFDSGHAQVAIYTVFHEESESAVRIDQILHPDEKIKKNQPTRVSIFYRKKNVICLHRMTF